MAKRSITRQPDSMVPSDPVNSLSDFAPQDAMVQDFSDLENAIRAGKSGKFPPSIPHNEQ